MKYILIILVAASLSPSAGYARQVMKQHTLSQNLTLNTKTNSYNWTIFINEKQFASYSKAKEYMATLGRGSEIHYFVNDLSLGNEPISNSKETIDDLEAFCKKHNLTLVLSLGGVKPKG